MILRHKETGVEIEVQRWLRRLQTVRRSVFAWAGALEPYLEACGRTHRLVMITLTYHYGEDWRPKAISEFMAKLKRTLLKNLLAYVWVAETQERGVIHYHVLVLVRRGTAIPKPDDSGMWNYGSTRIETAKTPYYVCEYVKKEKQKKGALPAGARVCASYIQKGLLTDSEIAEYKAACAPKWVRDMRGFLVGTGFVEETDKIKRKGSSWCLGELESQSEYELISSYESRDSEASVAEHSLRSTARRTGVAVRIDIPDRIRQSVREWAQNSS